jgi:hypothetical protein
MAINRELEKKNYYCRQTETDNLPATVLADRQRDRQIDKQAGRQADRQTDQQPQKRSDRLWHTERDCTNVSLVDSSSFFPLRTDKHPLIKLNLWLQPDWQQNHTKSVVIMISEALQINNSMLLMLWSISSHFLIPDLINYTQNRLKLDFKHEYEWKKFILSGKALGNSIFFYSCMCVQKRLCDQTWFCRTSTNNFWN